MAGHRIIVIGASAGGVEALSSLVASLPATLSASVFVTIHFPGSGTSVLPRILTRAGPLAAAHPHNGDRITPGRIAIAPPDHHLLILRETVRLVRGPKENGNRPAVDPMFRSAALAHGARTIGVVLSGNLDDGTSGLLAIKRQGGMAVVQDPEDALFPSMPQSALEHVDIDHSIPIAEMGALLAKLVEQLPETKEVTVDDDSMKEVEFSEVNIERIEHPEAHPGKPSSFGCPDCGGTLWELREEGLVRFRCRVGHAWTSEGLLSRQSETLDGALWTALRALEESASLSRQMSKRARARGSALMAERFDNNAELADRRAGVIRDALVHDHGVQLEPEVDPSEQEVTHETPRRIHEKAKRDRVRDELR